MSTTVKTISGNRRSRRGTGEMETVPLASATVVVEEASVAEVDEVNTLEEPETTDTPKASADEAQEEDKKDA
jgi:hypothetical protein